MIRHPLALQSLRAVAICAFAFFLASSGPARAQAGTGHLEVFAGLYTPDSDLVDDDLTFGLRSGYQFGDSWGYLFQSSVYTSKDFSATSEVFDLERVDYELYLLDFSLAWHARVGNQEGLSIFFGPGYAFSSIDGAGLDFDFAADDTFTLHAGAGWTFMLGDQVSLRPDVRARWFEVSESTDFEATIGLGWVFD
jgi:hypothetical protein